MSESLAHQNPQSPFRRAPSTIVRGQRGGQYGNKYNLTGDASVDTEELLKMAKDNIKNLKLKGKQVL